MKEIKEIAIELIDKFEHLKSDKISDDSYIEYPTAKLCALIAVDLVLDTLNQLSLEYEYWEEVKRELQKL